jgi:hypothetical protein
LRRAWGGKFTLISPTLERAADSWFRGTLPPQLLLETLDSIQNLLYPNDEKSIKSLDKFIEKYGYDADTKIFEKHIRELPEEFEYKYWGSRLVALLDIVNNPPPANRVVAWFERHTSERNALTVAILGLFLTALISFLSMSHIVTLAPSPSFVFHRLGSNRFDLLNRLGDLHH